MKKFYLFIVCMLFLIGATVAQSWAPVSGYQIAYGDVFGVTKHQGYLWVETSTGIYKVSGSSWDLTSSGFTTIGPYGCMYSDGNDLYAGSCFDYGLYKAMVLHWNGTAWNPVVYGNNSSNGFVKTILKTGSYLHFGGVFSGAGLISTAINSSVSYWGSYELSSGSLSTLFPLSTSGCASSVETIKKIGDSIYVFGGFSQVSTTWTPSTFRFLEYGNITILDGYGSCGLATSPLMFQGKLYAGGTRQSDVSSLNVGLTRMNSLWKSVSDTIQIIGSVAENYLGKVVVGGELAFNINGAASVVCSYDGSIVANEGYGISGIPAPFTFIPRVTSLFFDSVESKLYATGNFRKQDGGNVADNFAVKEIIITPVKLSSFTATIENQAAVLRWRDETPVSGVKVTVQYSADGRNFTDIGTVAEVSSVKTYSFSHPVSPCQRVYYRLSFEGKHSSIVGLSTPCDAVVTPLPGKVRINATAPGSIEVYNSLGQRLETIAFSKGLREYDIPQGISFVRVVTASTAQTVRLFH